MGGKGGGLLRGRGQGGQGKGKGAIVSETCGHQGVGPLVVRERMRKALQCRVTAHCQGVGAPAPPGKGVP